LMEKGSMDDAIASFDKVIGLDPGSSEAYNNRGAAESQNGDFARAAADLDTALRLGPDHEGAYGNRGFVRLALGDFTGAAADFGALAARRPDDPYRVLWRHLAWMRAGRISSTIQYLETTSASSSSVTGLAGPPAGMLSRSKTSTK